MKWHEPARCIMLAFLILALMIGAGTWSSARLSAADSNNDKMAQIEPLPCVGSYDNLKNLLKQTSGSIRHYVLEDVAVAPVRSEAALNSIQSKSGAQAQESKTYSSTNLQVAGVDEADIVKTDGKYIYQVNHTGINIIAAYPAQDMKKTAAITFDHPDFIPSEIYVDKTRLVVLGSATYPQVMPAPVLKPSIYPYYRPQQTTRVLVYDISNKEKISKIREVELEGYYVSSRKIGNNLYLVANSPIDYYFLEKTNNSVTPSYRDTAVGDSFKSVDFSCIRYFPGHITPNYMLVAAMCLDSSQPADIQTFLGASENIYATANHLYIAASTYNTRVRPIQNVPAYRDNSSTRIYRFALSQGAVKYTGKGDVPGTIINQFAMDESQTCLRIATTTGDYWQNGQYTSQSNVYVLDEDLCIKGRLEGIAPGENIYSTRFMGSRLYMVTFRNVDPLFVIDLSNGSAPRILGKLKIPGYSNYLHPYDENHIIGFGKDTVEGKGWDGQSQAYYQGMKVALFDVTDVNHPVEMDQEIIGDRGTDSELLHNHKALLFSSEKNLLAFPVTVAKISDAKHDITAYGSFAFQGAYIYNIDLAGGLQLKGTITHLTPEDYARAGDYWYNDNGNIQRVVYINNTLYTISNKMIKAHDISDLKEINTLALQ
jgi:inhibitor of cysteine peptidase